MINHKLLCLVLLVFGFNLMNSQKIDYKILLGIEHNDLVGDTIQLEKNTFTAFEKMRKAALAGLDEMQANGQIVSTQENPMPEGLVEPKK